METRILLAAAVLACSLTLNAQPLSNGKSATAEEEQRLQARFPDYRGVDADFYPHHVQAERFYSISAEDDAGRTAMGACIDCPPGKKTPSILLGLRAPAAAGAEELEGVLGGCVCRGAALTGWSASWVFFAQVPIELDSWDNRKRLVDDGKRLVEETREAMKERINPRVVRTLLSLYDWRCEKTEACGSDQALSSRKGERGGEQLEGAIAAVNKDHRLLGRP